MLARLILLTACLMAYSPTLRAGQIIFDCDVVFKVTGRATHHVIVVDTEHGVPVAAEPKLHFSRTAAHGCSGDKLDSRCEPLCLAMPCSLQ